MFQAKIMIIKNYDHLLSLFNPMVLIIVPLESIFPISSGNFYPALFYDFKFIRNLTCQKSFP